MTGIVAVSYPIRNSYFSFYHDKMECLFLLLKDHSGELLGLLLWGKRVQCLCNVLHEFFESVAVVSSLWNIAEGYYDSATGSVGQ